MKIVLIGYGKMGKEIEKVAQSQGHEVIARISRPTKAKDRTKAYVDGDVAIEFSHPDAALSNIMEALRAGIPVVSGTTGWLEHWDKVQELVDATKGSFFYASNFSIGVNIMFAMNEHLAKLMDQYPHYEVDIEETHHIHKKDAPSGTALTLAEGILGQLNRKTGWSLDKSPKETLHINAFREGEVFGDHKVRYTSKVDTIELYHTAHSRQGFVQGAVLAASWLFNQGKPKVGVFNMKDMMSLG